MGNYHAAGNKAKADSLSNRFLDYASKNTVKDPYALSCVYRFKNDYPKALEWEEKTLQQRSPSAYILALPFQYMGYENFYKSEGHQKILRQMGALE
jgi:hypothetical protein